MVMRIILTQIITCRNHLRRHLAMSACQKPPPGKAFGPKKYLQALVQQDAGDMLLIRMN